MLNHDPGVKGQNALFLLLIFLFVILLNSLVSHLTLSLPFPGDSPMRDLGTYLSPHWSTGIFEDKGYSFPVYFFSCLHLTPLSHSTTQPSYLHTAGILNGYKLHNAFSSHDTNSVLEKA